MGGDFMLVLLQVAAAGAHVKKGDVVAEFDRQYQMLRIDDYKDTVVQAEANVKRLKADLAVTRQAHDQQILVAKSDLDKAALDLKTIEVISDIDAERLKLAHEEAKARHVQLLKEVSLLEASQKADLRAAEIEWQQAKIELQRAQLNVDRMVLKAPMDGIVVMQSIRRGGEMGQAQQGDQIWPGQVFMQIVDPSSMVVNANVNQVDTESLRIGMKATVELDAFPGVSLPAHVYSIAAVASPGRRANWMKELKVRLKLDAQDPRVIPDLSASADVVLGAVRNATLAPRQAVFQDPGSSLSYVFIHSPGGWERREVKLGLSDRIHVAVESGLKAGDVIMVGSSVASSGGSSDTRSPT